MNNNKERLRKIIDRTEQYARGCAYPKKGGSSRFSSAPHSSAQYSSAPPPSLQPLSTPKGKPAPAQQTGITSTAAAPTPNSANPAQPTHQGQPRTPNQSGGRSDIPTQQPTRREQLKALAQQITHCTKCPLHEKRIQAVPGMGVLDPVVMVIGEAPGANEDKHGKPFIGRAGQYLDKWLEAIDIYRTQNAYIANIIKCRPPQNRDPLPAEVAQCKPYLEQQIAIIKPKTILIAGRIAAHHLFEINEPLASMRQQQYQFNGIPTLVTYHPSAVLRNPKLRQAVWDDLKKLKSLIAEQ